MAHYCEIAPYHPVHKAYHEHEYGYPQQDECILFERLCLEIFQAGLSWEIVLKKRPHLKSALANYNVKKIAAFTEAERAAFLSNPMVIRNRLKIDACIHNAQQVLRLREQGGFKAWLAANHPQQKASWVKIFKKQFRFMGPEIVGELLMSLGFLPDAHKSSCPVFAKIALHNPPWLLAEKSGFVYEGGVK